jgi:dynein heavy chain 1
MVPKLIAEDIPLLSNLLSGVFPGSTIPAITEIKLSEQLNKVCFHKFYKPNENFIQKVL